MDLHASLTFKTIVNGVYAFDHARRVRWDGIAVAVLMTFVGGFYTWAALQPPHHDDQYLFGGFAAIFCYLMVFIGLRGAFLTKVLIVDCNAGTYSLTRKWFKRTQVLQGDIRELDILIIEGGGNGDAILIRNRKGNWKVAAGVMVYSSRQLATELGDRLGIPVSYRW